MSFKTIEKRVAALKDIGYDLPCFITDALRETNCIYHLNIIKILDVEDGNEAMTDGCEEASKWLYMILNRLQNIMRNNMIEYPY